MSLLNTALLAKSRQQVTLTFQVPTSGFTEDATTGNQIPNTGPTTLTAWLKTASGSQYQRLQELAGLDSIQYPVDGRAECCIPDAVRHQNPCEATCTYDGMTGTLQIYTRNARGSVADVGERFLAVFVRD